MDVVTKFGTLWLDADEVGLTRVSFSEIPTSPQANNQILAQAKQELIDYTMGNRDQFDVKLSITKGTEFQQEVWKALQQIPYGQTWSYQDVATFIDRPKAVRAIGQANKANPLPIIIPCHRVIGKNGQLTGYMGAGEEGIAKKQALLALESNNSTLR
ncbi:MAG: methylated-DNA--[protein]-cysteine S-methyltransferase [Enterococcus sp.]